MSFTATLPLATSSTSSPTLKRCSSCSTGKVKSDFSGTQLKKQGKRVCKSCVAATAAACIFAPPEVCRYIVPLTADQVMSRLRFNVLVGNSYQPAQRVTTCVGDVPPGHCRIRYDHSGIVEDVPFAPACVAEPGTVGEGLLFPRFTSAGRDSIVTRRDLAKAVAASKAVPAP